MRKIVYILFVTLIFLACESKMNNPNSESESKRKALTVQDISGKVFEFGPDLDPKSCEVVAECDCCSDDVVFVNDTDCYMTVYCLEENTFHKGTYTVSNDKIEMTFSGKMVSQIDLIDTISDTIKNAATPGFTLKTETIGSEKITIDRLECAGKELFSYGTDQKQYGTLSKTPVNEYVATLKKEGIWQLLN